MKLVIVTATAISLGLAATSPDLAIAQEDGAAETPALRGTEGGGAAEAPAQIPAAVVAAAVPEPDPAARLAEARAAALAAAVPGAPADPLVANVADYALLQRDLAAIRERMIEEPEDLDAVMDTLASYDSATMSDAFLSYGAFIAAQQTGFVDRVKEVAEYYGVNQLVQGMINEPEYVLTFPGAREAAAVVLDVVREDVRAVAGMSGRFKQESYDLQNRGWSNLIAEDREERLNAIRDAQRLMSPSPDMLASVAYGAPIASDDPAGAGHLRRAAFWDAVDYRPDPSIEPAAAGGDREAESIGVMMTLAALRTLNLSQSRPDLVTHLLDLPTAKSCLDFALLHLRQCVAAAHFKYEDAFCIAEHQLQDSAECLGHIVNADAPMTPAPRPQVTEATFETAPAVTTAETVPAPAVAN